MGELADERTVREAMRAVSATGREPGRYAHAVNRYVGALGYAALVDRPTVGGTRGAQATTDLGPGTTGRTEPGADDGRAAAHTVVVGVDGSPASVVALDHAVIEAELRDWDLRLVHVARRAARDEGEALLAHLVDRVHSGSGRVSAVSRLHVGSPAATLTQEAAGAGLVVVGSSHGRAHEALAGSVGLHLAGHVSAPVLVVRMPGWPPRPDFAARPVVVGVDGSAESRVAVAFAAQEARLRGCDLVLLHATGDRSVQADGADPLDAPGIDLDGLAVRRRSADGEPRAAMVEASLAAAAIVVGWRGHSGLAGRLLGPVSQSLVHQAHCPVFIVH